MAMPTRLSIVTVTMNRTEHVIQSARAVARLGLHAEHLIVDYGSSPALQRQQLPADARIRLVRVDSPDGQWWLTHAYNLAFALAAGDCILKLDADVLLAPSFERALLCHGQLGQSELLCNRLTRQDWQMPSRWFTTNGLFVCRRDRLEALGGFNPYLRGWGWDEIDLYSRFFLDGASISRLPGDGVRLIEHGDDQREPPLLPARLGVTQALSPTRRMEANKRKNRWIAVESLNQGIRWPSLPEYADAYRRHGSLPLICPIDLLSPGQIQRLAPELVHALLAPNRLRDLVYSCLQRAGFGPYAPGPAARLLAACGIDLSLVSA